MVCRRHLLKAIHAAACMRLHGDHWWQREWTIYLLGRTVWSRPPCPRRAQISCRPFNIVAASTDLALLATCTSGCIVVSNLPAPVAYKKRILGGAVCLENGGTGRILSRWRICMHRRPRILSCCRCSSASRLHGLKLYTVAVHLEISQDCFLRSYSCRSQQQLVAS